MNTFILSYTLCTITVVCSYGSTSFRSEIIASLMDCVFIKIISCKRLSCFKHFPGFRRQVDDLELHLKPLDSPPASDKNDQGLDWAAYQSEESICGERESLLIKWEFLLLRKMKKLRWWWRVMRIKASLVRSLKSQIIKAILSHCDCSIFIQTAFNDQLKTSVASGWWFMYHLVRNKYWSD